MENKSYVKKYNKYGKLVNPITRANPYFVAQKKKIRKTRNKPNSKQYVQEIPLFVDIKGKSLKMSEVSFYSHDGVINVILPIDARCVGVRRIIHDIEK